MSVCHTVIDSLFKSLGNKSYEREASQCRAFVLRWPCRYGQVKNHFGPSEYRRTARVLTAQMVNERGQHIGWRQLAPSVI